MLGLVLGGSAGVALLAVGGYFIKHYTDLEERIFGPPKEQVLDLQSNAGEKSDGSKTQNLSVEDARALLRSFLRDKIQKYDKYDVATKFIYIKTDPGSHSEAGHSPLRAHVENFLFDEGFKFHRIDAKNLLKVDLEKPRTPSFP